MSRILISGTLLIYSSQSFATKCFTWQASSAERGYFITSDGVDLGGGITNYTINTFKVTATSISGVTLSTTFTETMPTQGFKYNGTNATQFWRSSGTYTNGSTFYLGTVGWSFNPNSFGIMNYSTYTSLVNISSLTITLDSSAAACASPPAPPVSAPSGLNLNDHVDIFATEEIELK